MITCCTLLLLLWTVAYGEQTGNEVESHTFKNIDPVTGAEVTCDRCPPGKFLRRRCTESTVSICEVCPPGSFTAIWNHIDRCLSCGVCGRNMVKASECRPHQDCSCHCKAGFYYKETAGMCVRWSECGTGTGATVTGTHLRNTECAPCANGTFSDAVSSQSGCSAHSVCQAPGSKVILKGSPWHDVICATCEEARGKDPGDFLRRLLPSFFSHHSLSLRRLKHVLSKLPPTDGAGKQRRSSSSGLNQDQLKTRLDQWVRQSSPDDLRTLPQILSETGAVYTAERLGHKLDRIQTNLNQLCPRSTTEGGLGQVQTTTAPGLSQD